MGTIKIGRKKVRALRHGMAGAPGLEVWGPYKDREEIRDAIVDAGEEFGLKQVGSRAYATNTLESGWIPSPLPAVYTDDRMKKYRKWLPANSYEATGGLAGSFVSNNIEDYYVTPYEIGYGPFVKFDHDFIGREALEKIANKPHRQKVTFAWNGDDVAKVFASMFARTVRSLQVHRPAAVELRLVVVRQDRRQDGKVVGASMFAGYSYNEQSMLSLGIVDPDVEIGSEVTLVWGEDRTAARRRLRSSATSSSKIRAIVSPVPYSKVVRETYAEGWRTGKAADRSLFSSAANGRAVARRSPVFFWGRQAPRTRRFGSAAKWR